MAEYLRAGAIGKPKVCDERRLTWTRQRREDFLNHLAATCNVALSCRAAGPCVSGAYALRRRDPAFAAQWRAALLTGYDRLEAALLEHATRALTAVEHDEIPTEPFDPRMAIQLLSIHEARMRAHEAGATRGGAKVRRATEAETDAAILKQLAALDRRLNARGGA